MHRIRHARPPPSAVATCQLFWSCLFFPGSNIGEPEGPLNSNNLWIIIACVAGVTAIAIAALITVLCRYV